MFPTDTVEERIVNINEFFTFSLYSNVCRSLFEKHKLMFAFLLCTRIMMNENQIDMVSDFTSLFTFMSPRNSFSMYELTQNHLLNLAIFSLSVCARLSGATCYQGGYLSSSLITQQ